jgi:hypothetical protein
MAGNSFSTGGDVANSVGAQSGFSSTYTTEQYALGATRMQLADEVESGLSQSTPAATSTILTGDEAGMGNSGVDRTKNFAKLGGDREWVFVYAAEAIAAGQLCEWDITSAYSVEPSDSDDNLTALLAGVADNAIAAGSYGWIIKRGTCVVLAASDVAAGEALASVASPEGQVDDNGTTGGTAVGYALENEGVTLDTYVQAYINLS